ncbi:hypothetical protein VTN00DRAFT_6010 [Thermoascus crustaceus]|uniref:uncharacterized protein n=1 Tax=Thermoascus crustaceus TaxID=5088 RepID=UPI003743AC4B
MLTERDGWRLPPSLCLPRVMCARPVPRRALLAACRLPSLIGPVPHPTGCPDVLLPAHVLCPNPPSSLESLPLTSSSSLSASRAHPDCLGRIAAYVFPETSASLSVTPRCGTGDSPGFRMCIALVDCRISLDKVLKRPKRLAQSRIASSTGLRSIPRIFLLES